MIKYWPQGEYTGDKGVKRQSLKAGLDTFDAAVAQVNEWEQAHHLLWAWVDVRSDQGKERVKLNKVQGLHQRMLIFKSENRKKGTE